MQKLFGYMRLKLAHIYYDSMYIQEAMYDMRENKVCEYAQ